MRRQLLFLPICGLLMVGACSHEPSESTASSGTTIKIARGPVSEAPTCAHLTRAAQPIFTGLFQSLVDDAQKLSAEQLAATARKVESSQLFADFEARLQVDGTAIEDKAKELKCSQADAKVAMCAAVTAVDAKGNLLAASMIAAMTAECG